MIRPITRTSIGTGSVLTALLLLSLSVIMPAAHAQGPFTIEVSIETVTFNLGAVTVTGTVSCSEPTSATDVSVEVRQPIHRLFSIRGSSFESLGPCVDSLPFSMFVAPNFGVFTADLAFVFANASACTEEGICLSDATGQTVILEEPDPS
jgi:hypothetical protein